MNSNKTKPGQQPKTTVHIREFKTEAIVPVRRKYNDDTVYHPCRDELHIDYISTVYGNDAHTSR